MGLTCFYKINKFFIFNICFLYHFSCIDVSFYFLVHCIYSLFSKWRPSAILDFKILSIFVKKSNYRLFLRRNAKYGEDRTIRGRVIGYFRFQNGGRPPHWISYFRNICQKFKFALISASTSKIWWRSHDPWSSYCIFSIFKMADVRHLGFGMTYSGPSKSCIWWS